MIHTEPVKQMGYKHKLLSCSPEVDQCDNSIQGVHPLIFQLTV